MRDARMSSFHIFKSMLAFWAFDVADLSYMFLALQRRARARFCGPTALCMSAVRVKPCSLCGVAKKLRFAHILLEERDGCRHFCDAPSTLNTALLAFVHEHSPSS
jgi:hypothetical protein